MSTLETLQDILVREFNLTREQLAPTAELNALGVDSLDLLELMFKIEDRFGVTIRDDTPSNLLTVADVVVYIDGLLARTPAARSAAREDRRSNLSS
jgi:acyl carrier protein